MSYSYKVKHFEQVINFFVGLLFLRLLEQIGPQILYTIFATFCLIAVAFVKKNVVETKGKSLQEIEVALLAPEQRGIFLLFTVLFGIIIVEIQLSKMIGEVLGSTLYNSWSQVKILDCTCITAFFLFINESGSILCTFRVFDFCFSRMLLLCDHFCLHKGLFFSLGSQFFQLKVQLTCVSVRSGWKTCTTQLGVNS